MANTQVNIGANGTTTLATAGKYCDRNIDVNVAVPASGITPTGTKSITENGEHDVTNFAKANVNVPIPSGYIKPSGTKSITANGTHDVTSYASAEVNVPIPSGYIKPSGSITITENNKTVDVTSYASAVINVAAAAGNITTEAYDVTIASGLGSPTGANSIHTLLTGNAFVKNNRDKDTFAVFMFAKTPVATASKLHHSIYHGNVNIGSSNVVRYGFSYCGSSSSALGFGAITNKLNANGYNCSFRTTTAGNLSIYVASDRTLPAGDYTLVLMNWEA